MSKRSKLFYQLYKVAGARLIVDEDLTKGQRERLSELLLDVLSDPDRYSAREVREKMRMAMEP